MRLLLTLIGLALSSNALAWWNDDWTQRKEITIDTTAAGADINAPLTEAQVLVRLSAGNFPQFFSVRDNGADLRFIAGDDQTPLRFHIERFDPVNEMAYVWVRLPAINAQSDAGNFFLYFGNPAAPSGSDPAASYDVATVAAFHFNETGGLPTDTTAYGTRAISGQLFPLPASIIGSGATLSGNEPLVLEAAPQLAVNPDNGWTFETWLRVPALPAEPAALLDLRGADGSRLALTVGPNGLVAALDANEVSSFAPLVAGTWHHVALVLGPDGLQLYLDGSQVGGAALAVPAMAGPVFIGGSAEGNALLAADLDELRISSVARSADWIRFAHGVQGINNDRVLRYAEDAAAAKASSGGNFGIIFQNVFGKPEAWVEQVVIIICVLMMLAAAFIMFLKAVALRRAARASHDFLIAYRALGASRGEEDQLAALYAERRRFGESPLWRVYHVGIDEVRKRMSPGVGAEFAGIEDRSMSAVRASMDATMVREGQRLSSQLVLLTIAISGGPFIGLFGTTVGVMVTFAAIAATGDVNIATIAPGMAAALLATVAGLGVAIPALFGYNYLGSRVKDQLADMRVFADELIARFNELYGA
jgi:biopolymer transport protein ExbB